MSVKKQKFNPSCDRCHRLVAYRREVKRQYPDYHCLPVPAMGPAKVGFLIVGLAPGLHGANRTGKPFIGDASGDFLYQALADFGFYKIPAPTCEAPEKAKLESKSSYGKLLDCRITNAVKCLPPKNKPVAAEVQNCLAYLRHEFSQLRQPKIIFTLGRIAHEASIKVFGQGLGRYPFAHGRIHHLDGFKIFNSYHCSRYNIATKRLDRPMFDEVLKSIKIELES